MNPDPGPPTWWTDDCRTLAAAHLDLARAARDERIARWTDVWWLEVKASRIDFAHVRAAMAELRHHDRTPKIADLLSVARKRARAAEPPAWRKDAPMTAAEIAESRVAGFASIGLYKFHIGKRAEAADRLATAKAERDTLGVRSDLVDSTIAELERRLAS